MVQVGRDGTRPVWPRLQCPRPWFYLLTHQLRDQQLWPQLGLLCPQEGSSLLQRQVWMHSWLGTASRDTMGIFSALSPGAFPPSRTLAEQEFVVFCSVSCSLQCELTALPLKLCLLPSDVDKPVLALLGHCLVRPLLSFPGGSLTTPLSSPREWGPGWSWYPWWVSWRASQWPNPLVRCSPPMPSLAPQPGAQPALLACSPACFYLLWFLKLWIFIQVTHVYVFWKKKNSENGVSNEKSLPVTGSIWQSTLCGHKRSCIEPLPVELFCVWYTPLHCQLISSWMWSLNIKVLWWDVK